MANLITCQMSCHVIARISISLSFFFYVREGSHSQAYNQTYFRKK